MVAELGWVAASLDLKDLAARCAARAQAAQDLNPRLRAELTLVWLEHKELLKHSAAAGPGPGSLGLASDALTVLNVNTRVSLVKRLEQALNTLLRLEDAQGIQDGSTLAWNVALPLLQHNTRHHVARCFTIAAKALRAVDSPLHRLRTQLHLESAKCSLAQDLVSAALQDANAGLALDYLATSKEEEARTGYERPLDRYLIPLHRSLALKTNPYAEPEDPEDQAILFVERAKDAKMVTAKQDALQRAIRALKSTSHPVMDYNAPVEQMQRVRQRAQIWAEIAKVAWAHRMDSICLEVGAAALLTLPCLPAPLLSPSALVCLPMASPPPIPCRRLRMLLPSSGAPWWTRS